MEELDMEPVNWRARELNRDWEKNHGQEVQVATQDGSSD